MSTTTKHLKFHLLTWLQQQLYLHMPWSYNLYSGDMYEDGLAPMTKQEFTYWMWYFDRVGVIDSTGHWGVEKHIHTDFLGYPETIYDWKVVDE